MIFGNIENLDEYAFLEAKVAECFAYAKENDLINFEKGSHTIDGERFFVNIVEYETTTPENRFWEAYSYNPSELFCTSLAPYFFRHLGVLVYM